MTTEEMERAIEALLGQSKQFNAALDRVREVVERLSESHVKSLEAQSEADRAEMREGFNNLIIANEVTRKLAEDVARLTIATI